MKIELKDGSFIEADAGSRILDIAAKISEGLARAALAAKFNGELVDLNTVLLEDGKLEILTFKDEEGREVYRHTSAHILAHAVKNIYPDAKLAVGPSTKNGFYYDFDFPSPVTPDDFPLIEKEINAIIKADFPITKKVVSKRQALSQMRGFGEGYKVELIEDLNKDAVITIYTQGSFIDLCKGPHLLSTGKVKQVKLTQMAGAYWKGDEKNKVLTRIYGTSFEKKSELNEYLEKMEEAKKRDHNKLGRELGYFMNEEKVGQGLPLLMPKGAKLFQILQRFVEDEEERRGYLLTRTPSMAKSDLYKISGHWDHYRDKMFIIPSGEKEDDAYALRPMTCPYQYMIYKNGLKSYRDLPIRYNETATLFRKEASGELHGLIRIREFHLSDGHVICTPEQLEGEFRACFELSLYFLECLGMLEDVSFRFSKWDPNDKKKYIGSAEDWDKSQGIMKQILDHMGIDYKEAEGEAAFYGPKLDIQIANVFGKEDTLMTIQVDMFMAEKFDMWYVNAQGERKNPYIIHRGAFGCYERVMAILIEKYAGVFPVWMSPVQVRILSLTERTAAAAQALREDLFAKGIRAETDNRNEKIGYKIREAQMEKIPYMLIIGDKEAESKQVSVRSFREGDIGTMSVDDFVARIRKQIEEKTA